VKIDLGVRIDGKTLRRCKCRNLGHIVILTFPLLLLKLEGYTADRTTLDTPHQMGSKAANLVAQTLRRDNGLPTKSPVYFKMAAALAKLEIADAPLHQ
jgi:hypothetical protein